MANIRQGIFQGEFLLSLLFVVCLLPLTHVLRDVAPRYHFASNGRKVDHLFFTDDLKLHDQQAHLELQKQRKRKKTKDKNEAE